jgi:hypothetical protein
MRWIVVSALSSLCCGAAYYAAPYRPVTSAFDPSQFGGQVWDGGLNHPRQIAALTPPPVYQPVITVRPDHRRVYHHRVHVRAIEPVPAPIRRPIRITRRLPQDPQVLHERQRLDGPASIAPRSEAYDRTHPARNNR